MHPGPRLAALSLALLATPGSCLHAFPALQTRNHHSRHDSNSDASAQLLQVATGASSRNLSFGRVCASSADRKYFLAPLLVPRLKLAFCYVPKVACSQFKDLINYLNGFGSWSQGFGHDYLISAGRNIGFPRQNVTKANGWKFATFTRDPATRYLSAFEDTCVANDAGWFEHPFECCGRLMFNNVSAKDMVKYFEQRVRRDSLNGTVEGDGHWVEQVAILKQCGWSDFRPENLDFWGQLSGDMNTQVKDMLRMVNHSEDQAVDALFPKNSKAGHRSSVRISPETFFRNLTILKAVMKLYEDDYALLPGVGCSFTDKLLNRSLNKSWLGCPNGSMPIPKWKRGKAVRHRVDGAGGNSTRQKAQ